MILNLTKKEIKILQTALRSAVENEDSLIGAHACPFCHRTKIFQGRPCICKTGIIKGSGALIRRQEKLIADFKQVYQKINPIKGV